ncbi:OmpA family protein [Colwellia hornerae]|uniref:OmpA family protein n=1 Tax=Colwellia hornerae TaxID=89402 RepID=A0A5C6QP99_9GAMM|nr:OmpA family protein [Colwellia hornerae]TWX56268.1 OmpA family protein [Colwellia hornerae]TWX62119.1 OmpA family protein [Colwellia hornerae]TWX70521.1 OmpA family protein [Colwellia hornerae]
MKSLNKASTLLLTSSFLLTSAFANEQPNAQDLVGKTYGGAHLLHINTDNDRVTSAGPYSNIDHGSGFGGELGYRWTESTEFRFSLSKINLVNEYVGFNEPNGSSIAVDALYFPTQQNFYVLGGVDYLDIANTQASLDVGAGYRHYLSERSAICIEGKGHYQFSEHFKDTSAKIGFIYFFGDSAQPRRTKIVAPVIKKEPAVTAVAPVAIVEKDTDKDGVLDKNDNCANTPMTDKVDSNGCTVFSDEKVRMELRVNFDNNKSIVKEEYFSKIEEVAEFLTLYPHTSLVIEGHTSKVGSRTYNQKISQSRAQAIVDVLVNKFSIQMSRLSAVGYGEDRLINSNDNKAAHIENRRIEAKIETTKKVVIKR